MTKTRNPIADAVAIVGVGSTGFSRDSQGLSHARLACDAATAAIRDAGLGAEDIDGVTVASYPGNPGARRMAALLGLREVTHYVDATGVFVGALIDAANAVFAGACESVLVVHAVYRSPYVSRAAALDPFRRSIAAYSTDPPETVRNAAAYAAWASRYLHEYGVSREQLGLVALNARANALSNPLAAMRSPLTMGDYLQARMIREPLSMLDMDLPVDGADAFVVTRADRAGDLTRTPVLLHAAATGLSGANEEDQLPDLRTHGQHVVARALRDKSDLWLDDVDVFYPYDGFSFITLAWLESLGWCAPGEASSFLAEHWDDAEQRVLIGGRVPINPNGGMLSEGATQGSGSVRDAVVQLRGAAGARQVPGAQVALVAPGGFFFNSQAAILRTAPT